MKLDRADLYLALGVARPALSNQTFIPILNHFLFDEGSSSLLAYNDVQAVRVYLDKCPIKGALPGETLYKLVGSMTCKEVDIETMHDGDVKIKGGRSALKLKSLPLSTSIFQDPVEGDRDITFDATQEFLDALEACLISVGTAHTNPSEMGITVTWNDKGMTLYSTDNRTISCAEVKTDTGDSGLSIILPREFCIRLLDIARSYEDELIEIVFSEEWVLAYFGESVELFSKLIADNGETAYDFDAILSQFLIDDEPDGSLAAVIPEEIGPALSRVLVILDSERDKEVNINLDEEGDDTLATIRAVGQFGKTTEILKLAAPMDPIQFNVDPALLQRAVTSADKITFLDKCVKFSSTDGDFIHLVSHNYVEAHEANEE